MNIRLNTWYRVPEVWLIIGLLSATVIGSLALVVTAVRHPDTQIHAPQAMASPLPPAAVKSTDKTTP